MFPYKLATFIEKEKKDCFNEYHNLLGNFWFWKSSRWRKVVFGFEETMESKRGN